MKVTLGKSVSVIYSNDMENGCANESLQFLNPITAELGKLLFPTSYSATGHLTSMSIQLYY